MKKIFLISIMVTLISCNPKKADQDRIITVSIAPYKYFIEQIAGDDFHVNIMVPAGSDPHIYEPYPEQISKLRSSEAYISNGFLGFEEIWLSRFYEMNTKMAKLSLGDRIDPILSEHHHEDEHVEGADPHYWVSPSAALIVAAEVKDLLVSLEPSSESKYDAGFSILAARIEEIRDKADSLFSDFKGRAFMIYHPNLAYLARDYGLKEIPIEYEGKEPPPSRLRDLIDLARKEKLNTILVQKEYDIKNAKAIADEIGAGIVVIDPLSEYWDESTEFMIESLYNSFTPGPK